MSGHLYNTKKALTEVFQNLWYILFALLFAFIIFSFNGLITNIQYITNNFSLTVLLGFMLGTFTSISLFSLMSLAIISLLSGIVLSLSIFLVKRQINQGLATGTSSLLLSIIAPSCPSCAFGFLSVIGFGSFLSILPLKGLELGLIAIILLLTSILYLSGKITTKVCKI